MSLVIRRPRREDLLAIHQLLSFTIKHTFELEQIAGASTEMEAEIRAKLNDFAEGLSSDNKEYYDLLAFVDDTLVGCMAYGPPSRMISSHLTTPLKDQIELKNAYVHPEFQQLGIGSALFEQIQQQLKRQGKKFFCLDCGFSRSQRFWAKRCGPATKVLSDHWGPGADHMIWVVSL